MAIYTLQQLRAIISPIAKRHGVKRVSEFGSYGRGQATASSDVDLSIEKGKIQTMLYFTERWRTHVALRFGSEIR